jgi:hypothetical protein
MCVFRISDLSERLGVFWRSDVRRYLAIVIELSDKTSLAAHRAGALVNDPTGTTGLRRVISGVKRFFATGEARRTRFLPGDP